MLRFTRPPFAAALLSASFACGGLLLAGCSSDDGQEYGADAHDDDHAHDDEHVHAVAEHGAGPHDGLIVELTTDHSVHGELVLESDTPGRGKLYLLAGDMKTPVLAKSAEMLFVGDDGEEVSLKLDPVGEANADSDEWSFLLDRLPNGGEGDVEGRIVVLGADDKEMETAFDTGHDEHAGHDHGDHEGHDHDGDDHGDHDHADGDHDHEDE
ncbi:hypothetical protein [Alienimonas chondri]|uniref:Copper chaperone PCu(A)C n=1 Tax=Alienimonas chondri TaxID=2681879 RepID=A0ABX1VGL1_9PLAN|nr:hypothetical protein [Alienimonas chondri]NNJ26977.1 hypothetical protein [Alienimonas chondri]